MSTIKSSAEDLTLNADGSNEVKFQINAVEKASINSSGLFTSTTIDATALTGNLPAISGASLTSLNASNLGSGTASVARGGTGAGTHTANNVLVGNGTSAIGSVAPSTSGNVLTSNGSSWASTAPAASGITIGTKQATTSGSDFTFSGIPSGTKRVVFTFNQMSTNGSDDYTLQLGDSGGIETTGYISSSHSLTDSGGANTSSTTTFVMDNASAAGTTVTGAYVFELVDATTFTWVGHSICKSYTNQVIMSGGSKDLSAELTQIKLDTTGSNTFDLGSVNISYE